MGTSVTGVFNSSTNDLYAVSPYIGLDIIHLSALTVLLGGWINPVSWNKAQGDSHAAWVFGSGGLKLAYLFELLRKKTYAMRELVLGSEGDTPPSNLRLKHESMSATHRPKNQRF